MPVDFEPDAMRITVGEPSGSRVEIWSPSYAPNDRDGLVSFLVRISGPGLEAETMVSTWERASPSGSLADFLRAVANDWKGLRGDQEWRATENDLAITATRDSLGHVRLTFKLREGFNPDAWTVTVTLTVEAGEEMSRLSTAAESLFPGPSG
jgi:hypothetical protein